MNTKEEIFVYDSKQKKEQNDLPMNWYNFYLNIRLPLSVAIIGGIITGILIDFFEKNPQYITFLGLIIIFFVAFSAFIILNILTFSIIYAMDNRKKEAYPLIIINTVFETIFIIASSINSGIIFVFIGTILATCWFISNYNYFSKRKYLFTN